MPKLKNAAAFICLAFVTIWLRLINLGYSDYQGDEIRALYRPQAGQELWGFLLSQKKGPLQFLATYVMRTFNPSYNNEFLMRLPFAAAGILAVYFFYRFAKLQFGKKIALYSSFLVATNGLFIAFSRIIQYQSFVILFSVLALYLLSLSIKYESWRIRGLYFGFCFWGLSLLAHYDGIFIAPFVFYILYQWRINNSSKPGSLNHLVLIFSIFILTLSIFYIPFFLSVSESTKEYWLQRATQDPGSDSFSTFRTYNPTIIIYPYIIFGLLSLFRIKINFSAWLWFLLPLIFMEVLVKDPGTHIYAYVLPFCILVAYGIEVATLLSRTVFKSQAGFLNKLLGAMALTFVFLVANVLFIDHSKEYQWEKKNFLVWEFSRKRNQSLFGFPYYRHWEEIGKYLEQIAGNERYYITNEKPSITKYYVPAGFKDIRLQELAAIDGYVYVIFIKNPQSRNDTILEKEQGYWEQYKPLKTFSNNGRVVAQIYHLSASNLEKN